MVLQTNVQIASICSKYHIAKEELFSTWWIKNIWQACSCMLTCLLFLSSKTPIKYKINHVAINIEQYVVPACLSSAGACFLTSAPPVHVGDTQLLYEANNKISNYLIEINDMHDCKNNWQKHIIITGSKNIDNWKLALHTAKQWVISLLSSLHPSDIISTLVAKSGQWIKHRPVIKWKQKDLQRNTEHAETTDLHGQLLCRHTKPAEP